MSDIIIENDKLYYFDFEYSKIVDEQFIKNVINSTDELKEDCKDKYFNNVDRSINLI